MTIFHCGAWKESRRCRLHNLYYNLGYPTFTVLHKRGTWYPDWQHLSIENYSTFKVGGGGG